MLRRSLFALAPLARLAAFPKNPAPEFKGKTMDGFTFTRDSLKGKPVLIQFWTTWCGYCRKDEPIVEYIAREYKDKLLVLAVNVNESDKKVKKYLQDSGRKCRVVLTQDTNLVALVRPDGFPYYMMIDDRSGIAAEQSGAGGSEGLRHLLSLVGL